MMRGVVTVSLCLLFAAAVLLGGCGVPKSEHEVLEEKYEKVQEEIAAFNEQAKKVQEVNITLTGKVKGLQEQVKGLMADKKKANAEYQKVLKEKKALEEKIAAAKAVKITQ